MNNETKQEAALGITPGEWVIMEFNGERCPFSIVTDSDEVAGNVVCNSPERTLTASLQYWPANAKLIAAAPELLQACREMIKHITETDFDVCGTPDELLNKWKAIIKKATE